MSAPEQTPEARARRETAADWIVRPDCGLTTAEAAIIAARDRRDGWMFAAVCALATAAAVAVFFALRTDSTVWAGAPQAAGIAAPVARTFATRAEPQQVTLADGSVVELNRESEIVERFTAADRRVGLLRGEAHFNVMHDAARPFVVRAADVAVRAVGTAFHVQLGSSAVEVLVTEGEVKVAFAHEASSPAAAPSLFAGQRASAAREGGAAGEPVRVTTASGEEISRALAWREPLLRLGGATLAQMAAAFEQSSGHRVIIPEPALAQLRSSGRFRAGDLEGFVKVLAAMDVDVERAADGALVLRKKTSTPR